MNKNENIIFKTSRGNIKLEIVDGVFAPSVAAQKVIEGIETREEEKGKKVLDLGTGTGVFAIYLAMNGYTDILAVDYQDISLECARKNARLNDVEKK